jgi:hypothetical protein
MTYYIFENTLFFISQVGSGSAGSVINRSSESGSESGSQGYGSTDPDLDPKENIYELPVELCALVDVDDSISGRFAMPDGIVQEALDSVQDNLKGKKYNFV